MIVFGIGLMAVGKAWMGVSVLGLGVLAMGFVLSSTAAGKAFFVAIGAMLFSGVMAYHALSNEITGTAVYHEPIPFSKGWTSEPVTRGDSPAKFRQATNFFWAGSIFALLAGAVAFKFYRKLEDCADDF